MHPCAKYAILWHMAPLYVANAALHNTHDPRWREYFMICVDSYADLLGAFRVAAGIVKSLLAIAIRHGAMSAAEARIILNQVLTKGTHHADVDDITAAFVVDLDLAVTQPFAARLKALAGKFDDITLFDEFTTASVSLEMPDENPLVDGDGPVL
jgi:plasmid stability protein